MLPLNLSIAVFGSALAVMFFVVLTWWILFKGRRKRRFDKHLRCRCGYVVENLSVPRCPECGRAIGFDKSFEELGISEEELRHRDKPK